MLSYFKSFIFKKKDNNNNLNFDNLPLELWQNIIDVGDYVEFVKLSSTNTFFKKSLRYNTSIKCIKNYIKLNNKRIDKHLIYIISEKIYDVEANFVTSDIIKNIMRCQINQYIDISIVKNSIDLWKLHGGILEDINIILCLQFDHIKDRISYKTVDFLLKCDNQFNLDKSVVFITYLIDNSCYLYFKDNITVFKI